MNLDFETSQAPHNMQEFWVENDQIHTKDYAKVKLEAIQKLQSTFAGKRVIDIGSNDGLYSLVCKQGGASEVLANEIDSVSLATSERLFSRFSQRIQTTGKNLFVEPMPEYRSYFDYALFLTVIHRVWYPGHPRKFKIEHVFDTLDYYCNRGIVTDYWIRKSAKPFYKKTEFEEFIFSRYRVESLGTSESDWWESELYLLLPPCRFIL